MLSYLAMPFWNRKEHRLRALWRILLHALFLFLIAAPLTALVSPAAGRLPDLVSELIVQAVLLLGSLAALWLAGRLLDRRPFADYGFRLNRQWWLDLGFGLFLGALLLTLIFLIEYGAGWITISGTRQTESDNFALAIVIALLNFIQVGITEEILSRGYHLRNMAEGFNGWKIGPRAALLLGYLLSSALFGLLHLGNPNATWISAFNITLAGILLGLGLVLTRSLAIPIGVHITWNFFQGNVFGFPVSGLDAGSTFIAIQQSGPELWTGGAFGPEAGLTGLLVMALGCLLTLAWVKWQYGKITLQTGLAEYTPPPAIQPSND